MAQRWWLNSLVFLKWPLLLLISHYASQLHGPLGWPPRLPPKFLISAPVPFHSCWIHLYSSLSIDSQTRCLLFLFSKQLDRSLVYRSEWCIWPFSFESACQRNGKKESIYLVWCKTLEKSPILPHLHQHKVMAFNITFLVYLFLPFTVNLESEYPQHKSVTVLFKITCFVSLWHVL